VRRRTKTQRSTPEISLGIAVTSECRPRATRLLCLIFLIFLRGGCKPCKPVFVVVAVSRTRFALNKKKLAKEKEQVRVGSGPREKSDAPPPGEFPRATAADVFKPVFFLPSLFFHGRCYRQFGFEEKGPKITVGQNFRNLCFPGYPKAGYWPLLGSLSVAIFRFGRVYPRWTSFSKMDPSSACDAVQKRVRRRVKTQINIIPSLASGKKIS